MSIVLLLDQRRSSHGPDLVRQRAARLNTMFADDLVSPFVRTAGDEMQAILGQPSALALLLTPVIEEQAWWVGVGLGAVTRTGRSTRESAGPAFSAARSAIDAAKRDRGARRMIAVDGDPIEIARSLQAALVAFAFILQNRTPRQREVVAAVQAHSTQRAASDYLGITPQAVSDALLAAGYGPVLLLTDLISDLAEQAGDA